MDSTNLETGSSQSSGSGSAEKDQQLPGSSTGPASPKPDSTGQASPELESKGPVSPEPESTGSASPEPNQKRKPPEKVILDMVFNSVKRGNSSSEPQPINGTEGRTNPFTEAAASQNTNEQEKQQQQEQHKQQVSEPDSSPSLPNPGK